MENRLSNSAPDRKYFTVVPNLLDELDLSPIAFRLYFHLRRIAGEEVEIRKSTKKLADKVGCSSGAITNAKRELELLGLINIQEKANERHVYHIIVVCDVWKRNVEEFHSDRSPGERSCSPGERLRSCGERIEEHKKEELINKEKKEKKESSTFEKNVPVNQEGAGDKIAELRQRVLGNEKYLIPMLTRLKLLPADFSELAEIFSNTNFDYEYESDNHLRRAFAKWLDGARNLLREQRNKGKPNAFAGTKKPLEFKTSTDLF
jgi:hypothetical protein